MIWQYRAKLINNNTFNINRGVIITGIYKIVNKLNNKIYIGKSKNIETRIKRHKNDYKWTNTYLYYAMRKYGVENFDFEIVEECNESELNDREIYWIDYYKSFYKVGSGYNMTKGGERLFGEENPFYGKHHTKETIEYFSYLASQKTGENNPFYGKHHTNDTKIKISTANTGKVRTNEQKRKISTRETGENNPFYGKHHTDEAKKKMSLSKMKTFIAISENGEKVYFKGYKSICDFLNQIQHPDVIEKKIRNAIKENKKVYGYYWLESVETIETTSEMMEGSRVGMGEIPISEVQGTA